MMPPMDKPMDSKPPMDEKDSKVKCPACGEMLLLEKSDMEMPMDKPMAKPMDKAPMDRADKMPMDKMKNMLMSAKPKPEPQGY